MQLFVLEYGVPFFLTFLIFPEPLHTLHITACVLYTISECVLKDFSISYGGEGRFKTFDPDESGSPPPVETSISLTFEELELITRERVEDGRALGGQIGFGPSNPVNS